MKRIIKYFLTLCAGLIAVICIAACGESHTPSSSKELEQLKMPTHLKADFWELSWEAVENANGYTVRVLDEEYQTNETEFSLFAYLSPNKRYTLDVKANGDGENYADSEWESVIYQTEKLTENISVRLILEFENDFVEGLAGTYEVSILPKNIPTNGEVVLPDYINGKPVTSYSMPYVLNGVFSYPQLKAIRLPNTLRQINGGFRDSSVQEIYIPNGVEYIAGFYNCKKLKQVWIPESVTTVGHFAFSGCTALESIKLPNSLKEIGNYAFLNAGLKTIDLPNGLIEIGNYAFQGTDLTTLEIPKSVSLIRRDILLDTPWYEAQEVGFLYLGDVLYGYKGEMPQIAELKATDFKSGVRLLAGSVFENKTSLKSVELPDSVEGLGSYVFSGCVSLANINFPDKLKEIGPVAFYATALTSVEIPGNVKRIGSSGFQGCNALESVVINEGVEYIGAGAFSGCSNLKSAVLPSTLKGLTNGIFGTKNLSEVKIADGTTEIFDGFFRSCSGLKEINIPESVTKIGKMAFRYSGLVSVQIPKNLTVLGEGAFWDCADLESIVLPREITELDITAFYGNDKFKKIFYTGTQTEWNNVVLNRNNIEILYNYYTTVPYYHTQAEIDAWLDEFEQSIKVYCYSEVEPIGAGNFWHYDKDGKPVEW